MTVFADSEIRRGKRVAVSPVTDEPYLVTRWVALGEGKIRALDKQAVDDRLFVPLKTHHYRNFESGLKDVELRGLNDQFNPDTVFEGRPVELRRGYSTDDSIWGLITNVWLFDELNQVPERIDHDRILPGSSWTKFMDSAEALVGDYDHWIAFCVGDDLRTDGGQVDRCRKCGVDLGAGYLCDGCDTVEGWDDA